MKETGYIVHQGGIVFGAGMDLRSACEHAVDYAELEDWNIEALLEDIKHYDPRNVDHSVDLTYQQASRQAVEAVRRDGADAELDWHSITDHLGRVILIRQGEAVYQN